MFSARTVAWLLAILVGVIVWVYVMKTPSRHQQGGVPPSADVVATPAPAGSPAAP